MQFSDHHRLDKADSESVPQDLIQTGLQILTYVMHLVVTIDSTLIEWDSTKGVGLCSSRV